MSFRDSSNILNKLSSVESELNYLKVHLNLSDNQMNSDEVIAALLLFIESNHEVG